MLRRDYPGGRYRNTTWPSAELLKRARTRDLLHGPLACDKIIRQDICHAVEDSLRPKEPLVVRVSNLIEGDQRKPGNPAFFADAC